MKSGLRAICAAMKTGDARGRPCEGTSALAAAPALLIAVRLIKECAMTTHEMREAIESCGLLESNADVLALAAEQER